MMTARQTLDVLPSASSQPAPQTDAAPTHAVPPCHYPARGEHRSCNYRVLQTQASQASLA